MLVSSTLRHVGRHRRHGLRLIRFLIALSVLLLASCADLRKTPTPTPVPTRSAFDTRLQNLSSDPSVQRAAQYRLMSSPSGDPAALAATIGSTGQAPESVRTILLRDVDDVVIVDWLVSFSAMGLWTADNPHTSEVVSIPVTDIASRVQQAPVDLGVYRLRDQKHLMLVRPVVVRNIPLGAVGFILAQAYESPDLDALAVQLS